MLRSYLRLATIVVFLLITLVIIARITPIVNDDVYVYYNYARNFAEGRPFAYDMRNIPSEGFTSLIYVLALVPFEILSINMTFASTLLNLAALASIVGLAVWLVYLSRLLDSTTLHLFGTLCLVLLAIDRNIVGMIEWGLETMLGPVTILIAAVLIQLACDSTRTAKTRRWAITGFYLSAFMSYLVRPENLAFVSIGGLFLLVASFSRRDVIVKGLMFVMGFAGYHLGKLVVFGDIFPTGYYRKVTAGDGANYVADGLEFYSSHLTILGVVVACIIVMAILTRQRRILSQQWVWFIAVTSVMTLIFFTYTNPLVGYSFRFLVNPIVFGYLIFAFFAMWLLENALNTFRNRTVSQSVMVAGVLMAGVMCAAYLIHGASTGNIALLNQLNLYQRSVKATEAHPYLHFGEYLNTHLQNHSDITFVFGDAGAIPYSLDGRFIDFNGLTEPPIARLFQLPDGVEKTQRFTDHILKQAPDIAVLAYGRATEGIWSLPVNPHSPFRQVWPLAYYESLRDYGIMYACTINSAFYDLHLGVAHQSAYAETILETLLDYCDENGFVFDQGLTVRSAEGRVHFPALSEAPNHSQ